MSCCGMINIAGLLGGGGGGSGGLSLPMGACVAAGTCTQMISIECGSAADCASGQVCCSGTPSDGGEAGAAPSLDAGGGLAGGLGGLMGFKIATACQTSCMPGQQQQCASAMECLTPGQTCQSAFPGAGGGAGEGGAGGAGGAAGGGVPGFMLPNFCMAPPMEGGVGPDTGTDAAPDGTSMVDAGNQSDAPAGDGATE
jgi:hypothetical protein